jgi:ATP-binding cassette subfamily B protein
VTDRARAIRATLAYSFHADRPRSIAAVGLQIAAAANTTLTGVWVKLLVDGATSGAVAPMTIGAIGLAGFVFVGVLLDAAGARVNLVLREKVVQAMETDLLRAVARSPGLGFHEEHEHLKQLELWQAESWQFGHAVPALVDLLFIATRVLFTAVLLASISPLLLVFPLFGVPTILMSGKTSGLYLLGAERAAEPSRRAQSLFDLATRAAPAKEMRAFGLENEVLRRYRQAHREIQAIHWSLQVRARLMSLAPRLLFITGYALAIAYVTSRAAAGQASVGDVVLTIVVVAGQVLGWLAVSADLIQFALRTMIAVGRFLSLLDAVRQPQPAVPGGVAPPGQLTDGIRLVGVSFHYQAERGEALTNVTLRLPAGSTVALVGDNGAGKTTLVKLLGRYYEPTAGVITVDGIDLRDLDLEGWRARLSGAFQDFARLEFFSRESVGVGWLPDIARTGAVQTALERAAAGELIERWPAGLETQLGPTLPGGVDLSGGEWQKVALARAMMRTSPLLLILDEPSAALDPESEHELFAHYASAARAVGASTGAITLLVSHRFSTVRMADLIAVLDGGELIEFGTHAELMARRGHYAELFTLSARAYT